MGKIIAIVNQKGGVGKSTTCVNLGAALRERGKTVLCCDSDPQGNTTSGFGGDKNKLSPTLYDALIGAAAPGLCIHKTRYVELMPANKALSGAEIELVALEGREYRLKDALAQVRDGYDYILIDCPPSLGLLTLGALCAADTVLIPVQCEYYALEGLSDLMYTVRTVRKSLNPGLEIEGVLLTMFDSRTNLSMQVATEVKRYFPGKVFGACVPRNVRLSEAPSHGMPVFYYDRYSRGADSYFDLADEIIKNNSEGKS